MRLIGVLLATTVLLVVAVVVLLMQPEPVSTPAPIVIRKQQAPLQLLIRELAASDGISRDEAGRIGMEVFKRLWHDDPVSKVASCEINETGDAWVVVVWADHSIAGCGCRAVIHMAGALERIEYIPGT
jgi:hypothetical protein